MSDKIINPSPSSLFYVYCVQCGHNEIKIIVACQEDENYFWIKQAFTTHFHKQPKRSPAAFYFRSQQDAQDCLTEVLKHGKFSFLNVWDYYWSRDYLDGEEKIVQKELDKGFWNRALQLSSERFE